MLKQILSGLKHFSLFSGAWEQSQRKWKPEIIQNCHANIDKWNYSQFTFSIQINVMNNYAVNYYRFLTISENMRVLEIEIKKTATISTFKYYSCLHACCSISVWYNQCICLQNKATMETNLNSIQGAIKSLKVTPVSWNTGPFFLHQGLFGRPISEE